MQVKDRLIKPVAQVLLSILYLRCQNTLFAPRLDIKYTFNSLFEMPTPQEYRGPHS